MAARIQLEIYTPEGAGLSVQADEVAAVGPLGEFGVLPGHTYLVTRIEPGFIEYVSEGKRTRLEISSGFCQVGDDRMTVLADALGEGASKVAASISTEASAEERSSDITN